MFSKRPLTKLQSNNALASGCASCIRRNLEQFHSLYNRSVEGADTIHALVLGATPELRDIVLSYGHTLTTIDRDAAAVEEKTSQMHYAHHPNEEIINEDWLTVHFPKANFDVVLGDGVLTTLDQNDQRVLLDHIHDWLKPTGATCYCVKVPFTSTSPLCP